MPRDYVFVTIYYGNWFTTGAGTGPLLVERHGRRARHVDREQLLRRAPPAGPRECEHPLIARPPDGRPACVVECPALVREPADGFTNDDVANFIRNELDHQRVPRRRMTSTCRLPMWSS